MRRFKSFRPTRLQRGAPGVLALLLTLALGEAVAQTPPAAGVPAAATSVSVGGDVPRPFTLTLDDLKAMPHTTVTVDAEGKPPPMRACCWVRSSSALERRSGATCPERR
jgi:hypothetical protein